VSKTDNDDDMTRWR